MNKMFFLLSLFLIGCAPTLTKENVSQFDNVTLCKQLMMGKGDLFIAKELNNRKARCKDILELAQAEDAKKAQAFQQAGQYGMFLQQQSQPHSLAPTPTMTTCTQQGVFTNCATR